MQKKYTAIVGGSWCCGEWQNFCLTHGGLRQYMEEDGQPTICFGSPGGGNLMPIQRFIGFLDFNPSFSIKQLVFFQSDWLRDVPDTWQGKIENFQLGYRKVRDQHLSNVYKQLSLIYRRYQIPSLVIGSSSDTIWSESFEKDYPGVKIGCQSLTNLSENNRDRIDNPCYSVFRVGPTKSLGLPDDSYDLIIDTMKKYSDTNDVKFFVNDLEEAEKRNQIFDTSPNFPDKMHPDRTAHYKLYQLLKDNQLLL